jgi:hypothetical protein
MISGSGRNFYEVAAEGTRFLVKVGAEPNELAYGLARTLSGLPRPCYRSPTFYGRLDKTEVWEYVAGHSKALASYSQPELEALLEGVVAVETAVHSPDLPQTYWLKPVAKQLQAAAETDVRFRPFAPQIRQIAAWEGRLIAAAAPSCLTHNDLHSHNVILGDERIHVVDWESASLGPPGATLRCFGNWPMAEQRRIAIGYARYRARYGHPVAVRDVLFAMNLHQAFWALRTAARQRKPDRLLRGWRLFQPLIPRCSTEEPAPMTYQPASKELKRRIHEFMDRNRGKLYHKIPHPDFEGLPVSHGEERFSVLRPHLDPDGAGRTVLDIGTHWGQLAHWLEDMGYDVTAVEHAPKHAYIARGIRDICGKKFRVVEDSIFNVSPLEYDVVLALNIFHHFLKTEAGFNDLTALLGRLRTPLLFFQSHTPEEKQMEGAYRNMDQDDFAAFVKEKGGFPNIERIGTIHRRNIYKLWQ